jgi:methylmalonyl-CoA mutase cobalamin-binding subunit
MERAMSEKVVIFDTTLRDGEQSPGISLDPGEKLEIAEQLARLGVDYIEAGFPVSSQGDFDAVQAIARTVHGPIITGLSRTQIADVDRCYEALRDADANRIHVFISTSPSHMEHMLKMNEAQVIEQVRQGVSRARRVLAARRHADPARVHARGLGGRSRVWGHDFEHPRHRRLRHPMGLRRSAHPRPRADSGRLCDLDPLS